MERAATEGHCDIVNFFIARGANAWEVSIESAFLNGHYDLVEYLSNHPERRS